MFDEPLPFPVPRYCIAWFHVIARLRKQKLDGFLTGLASHDFGLVIVSFGVDYAIPIRVIGGRHRSYPRPLHFFFYFRFRIRKRKAFKDGDLTPLRACLNQITTESFRVFLVGKITTGGPIIFSGPSVGA